LGQRGLPNLWVPAADSFAEIGELPMLGSGKLDLRRLQEMALERFAEAHSS
jgi:acyl-[acyl-carrier-protein]-phospholipid O-acyltransferase/long-chain-fatty-acid--[acyl-carrier-protein] ligase